MIIIPYNVYSLISYDKQEEEDLKSLLNFGLKVNVPGAEYLYAYRSGQWDGKAALWETDKNNIIIRTGLIPRFIGLLKQGNIKWSPGGDNRGLLNNYKFQKTKIALRDYQYAAVKAAFGNRLNSFGWWPRGVIEAPPGAGKTEIAVAMYEINPVPTFFLVHRKDLLIQAKERFEKYNYKVGIIGNQEFKPEAMINVVTMQTLNSIFKDLNSSRAGITTALIQDCKQVFFDESHLLSANLEKGNEFVRIADKFEAPFRWGLTATPFMRTQYDNLLLEGVTGPSVFRISFSELIKKGYLTPPKVIMLDVPGKMLASIDWKRSKSSKAKAAYWREVESKGIKFNEIRTNLIIDEIEKGPYPLLVLVKTVEQAEFIKRLNLLRGNSDLRFLSGKDSAKLRREAVRQLQEGELNSLLTTTIFDEGIDIPELRKVILASGGKSNVKMIQRLGRSVRKAVGKKEAIIIDFQDNHHIMLARHANERKRIWKEQKFKIQYK